MVRPSAFAFNEETAGSNAFQSDDAMGKSDLVRRNAIQEFDFFVQKLRDAGVQVIVARDTATPLKPDAVFPNNWITFHQEGYIITYPMFAPVRRKERRKQIINTVLNAGFTFEKRISLEYHEKLNQFLEGTGSILFDHQNKLAYACLSPRTEGSLLQFLCDELGYRPVLFEAVDGEGKAIYHTNVMMALGETFVVICLDAVQKAEERVKLETLFAETGKAVVCISPDQMGQFAGNMLQVQSRSGKRLLVMSEQAYKSLEAAQVEQLERHTALLHAPLYTIEKYGGGSARCMMAEIFLPERVI
jgi:hypothetical protein